MFITLRNSGSGRQEKKKGEMEQVARRNAVPGRVNDRVRAIRRTACLSCQAKKLRCTGAGRECDRCKSRSIQCVFPVCRAAGASNPSRQEPDNILFDAQTGESEQSGMVLVSGVSALVPSPSAEIPTASTPSGGGLTADDFYFLDADAFDAAEFDFDFLNDGDPASMLFSDGQPGIPDASVPSPDGPSFSVPTPESTAGSSSSSCACISDLLRTIQQMDDDEFGLASLATDQVIQVQKYLTFQCFKPLSCRYCSDSSTASTLMFGLCDRLTEFFECMGRRLDRTRLFLDGKDAYGSDLPIDKTVARTQVFCGTSGQPAEWAQCNLIVFSDEFRSQYSNEEQLHMIKVLLELQIRNYRSLLEKLGAIPHVKNTPARKARVDLMRERLVKATGDIDRAWAGIMEIST